MRLVALDLETTGLNPQEDQILEVGMVCFESETGGVVGEFETLVRHDRYHGDPFALSMNSNILARLADGEGIKLKHLDDWIADNLECCLGYGNLEKPHAVGFNVAPFDIAFLKAAGIDRFHHRAAEIGTLLMKHPECQSDSPVTSNKAIKLLGSEREVAHTALEDCTMARELYMIAMGRSDTA